MTLPEVLINPSIVGREQELKKLYEVQESAFQGRGRVVFVSGEAGSGKTTLINEFLLKAKNEGNVILVGRCLSNAAVPYFPFFEAFNAFFNYKESKLDSQNDSIPIGNEVIDWLNGPTSQGSESRLISAQSWKDQTFTSVMKTLSLIAEKKPIILFIDDLQWADSASLTLLHYIARFAESKKVMLLSTFRSEEVLSDVEGRSSLLLETLRIMGREELSDEIKLESLNPQQVARIAEKMLGGKVSSKLIEMLYKESLGNPLFIVESIRMLSERKNLIQENGEWLLTVNSLTIPNKIKEIILRRLGWLKSSQRRVLDAASVIGEKFDVDLVSSVLNIDALEVLDTLNVVAQSTSLVLVDGDYYRFNHAKSKEAIYGEIPAPLRKAYHLRIAQKLEEKQNNYQMFADIAYHYAHSTNKEKAIQFAFLAGQDALARWSNQEAINYFKYILENISNDTQKDELISTVKEALGDAYYANCTFEDAYVMFIDLARSKTGKTQIRTYRKAIDSKFRKADYKQLLDLVKEAEQYVSSDKLESARLLWGRARAEAFLGDHKGSLRDHLIALQVFEEEYSLPDVAQLLCGTSSTYSYSGNPEKGLEFALRSTALFKELKDYDGELNACQIEANCLAFAGLGVEAKTKWLKVLELSKKISQYSYMGFAYYAIANAYETSEDFEEAVENSLMVLEVSKKTDNKFYLVSAYGNLARQYPRLGNLEKAEFYLNELLKSKLIVGGPWFDFFVESSRAIIESSKKNWKQADEHFKQTFELIKIIGNLAIWDRRIRRHYIWALKAQGKIAEAEIQLRAISDRFDFIDKKYSAPFIKAKLMAKQTISIGEELEIRVDLVTLSRNPALKVEINNLNLNDFIIMSLPTNSVKENGLLKIKNGDVGPFQVNTAKIGVKASKIGTFKLQPSGTYLNNVGETKSFEFEPITIKVDPRKDSGQSAKNQRVAFGDPILDNLLLGGIPEKYAIALTAVTSNEEELLKEKFLQKGLEEAETTLYLTTNMEIVKRLTGVSPDNLLCIICNQHIDASISTTNKIIKLKGVENLTEIDIALTKALRTINLENDLKKRACIDILSDVLLQHHTVNTRKWLSGILLTLKSKGFTTLAIINPLMHPTEEIEAILSLFDGEIELIEKEMNKKLRIRRLSGQALKENETILT